MVGQSEQGKKQKQRRIWAGVIIMLLLFAAAAAWRWTPLAELISPHRLAGWAASVRESPVRHFYVLAAYVVGSLLFIPVTALILVTAIIFGPILGSLYALVGCLTAAAVTYAIGLLIGEDFVRKVTSAKWQRAQRKIGQAGIVAVATLRLLPVAPFTVVNIVSGAFKIPLRDYIFGSLLGLAPGILVTSLFAHQVEHAIRNPGIGVFLLLMALVGIVIIATVWLKRRFEDA